MRLDLVRRGPALDSWVGWGLDAGGTVLSLRTQMAPVTRQRPGRHRRLHLLRPAAGFTLDEAQPPYHLTVALALQNYTSFLAR